jgi:hypothetical protein
MPCHANRRYVSTSVAGLLLAMGLCAVAAPAHAQLLLGGDVDLALPVKSSAETGGGFAVRVGYHAHVPLAALTSEVGFNYDGFSGSDGPTVYRGLAGLRLGVGEVFRLGGYAHVGVGRLVGDTSAADSDRTGFTYDIGLLLEFTLLPFLNLGAHGAYNQMPDRDGESFQWMSVGGHVDLILG